MRILLAEDDPLLGDGIMVGLRQDGHAVDWVRRAEFATKALATSAFDLMLLDLGLPDRDGLSVLRNMRKTGDSTPVLVITARDALAERILGLDLGADDYIVKPFDLEELCARVRALGRRAGERRELLLKVGRLVLDPSTRQVMHHGVAVELAPREFSLLCILMENAGRVLLRTRLQELLYGWDQDVQSNALEVHVHHLRRKLGPEIIRTVRGVGYLLSGKD